MLETLPDYSIEEERTGVTYKVTPVRRKVYISGLPPLAQQWAKEPLLRCRYNT